MLYNPTQTASILILKYFYFFQHFRSFLVENSNSSISGSLSLSHSLTSCKISSINVQQKSFILWKFSSKVEKVEWFLFWWHNNDDVDDGDDDDDDNDSDNDNYYENYHDDDYDDDYVDDNNDINNENNDNIGPQ